MLRQVLRNRGAYNFVNNIQVAATQDDPSAAGRGDPNADWRRNYSPAAAESDYREDAGIQMYPTYYPPMWNMAYAMPMACNFAEPYVMADPCSMPEPYWPVGYQPQQVWNDNWNANTVEAWDRPNWYNDHKISSTAAAKILRKRLEVYGPQRERSLQEVFSRIRNEKDAKMALKAAELFRRYRASREQHTPFKIATSKMIIERALEVDARDVAVQALERKDELGFNFISLKAYRLAITHLSMKGDLANVLKVFNLAKKQGLKPNRDIGFCVLRACLDCNRADLAHAYALEFQENGIRVSPAQKVLIEAGSGKELPSFRGEEHSEIADTEIPEEDNEVLEQADLIIDAASSISKEATSVNAEGTAEAVTAQGDKVVTEPAAKEIAGSSTKVVAAVAVAQETPETKEVAPVKIAETPSEPEAELDVASVPGLEAAVKEKLSLLFPRKEQAEKPTLRRVNSV